MKIGIPMEIKTMEGRVALVPEACADLIKSGNKVFIQASAGEKSGYSDKQYQSSGVKIMPDIESIYEAAQLIVKVKEPIEPEYHLFKQEHVIFSYLHLAAVPSLLNQFIKTGLTAIAFETVEVNGLLPLLAPMSNIAGRLSIQIGAHLLHRAQGGRGVLLGGLPAADRGSVVILGAGQAGGNAARLAASLGANVIIFDKRHDRLAQMHDLGANVTALYPYKAAVANAVAQADLLVGAVLVTGAKAPVLVSKKEVKAMQSGSVIIDIAVDQGGCIETIKPTTYVDPTYLKYDVIHFGVTNMPGTVPRSASQVLSSAILPFTQALSKKDWRKNMALTSGINVEKGEIKHPGLLD